MNILVKILLAGAAIALVDSLITRRVEEEFIKLGTSDAPDDAEDNIISEHVEQ